jgi:chemotaxis protein methyltransferase CheR
MADLDQSWTRVRGFMRDRCGVVIAPEQIYLMEARLLPVARKHAFNSIVDYVEAACAPSAPRPLSLALIDAMTTHETFFFRDTVFFEALDVNIIPRVLAATTGASPLRIWCAACSTGQEPYSVAMLLAERHPALFERTQIIATDVSDLTLEQAQAGVYSTIEANRGLHATRLLRHLEQVPGGFRIAERLRRRITWRTCNLLEPWCHEDAYDIVLCRNVLIYFSSDDREKVINRLYSVVRRDGCVGVGSTETIKGRRLSPGWYTDEKAVQR